MARGTAQPGSAASGPFEVAFKAVSEQPKLSGAFKLSGNYRYGLARKRERPERRRYHPPQRGQQRQLEAKLSLSALEGAAAQWRIGKVGRGEILHTPR